MALTVTSTPAISAPTRSPQLARPVAPAAHAAPEPAGWTDFLQRTHAIRKADLVPNPADMAPKPPYQGVRLKEAILAVPAGLEPGVRLALDDLQQHLEQVTGRPVRQVTLAPGQPLSLPADAADATIIAVGQGRAMPGLVPAPSGHAEGFVIQATETEVQGRRVPVIGLSGDDLRGTQYAVYRLMELSGARFFRSNDTYLPPAEEARFPAKGFQERYAPSDQMKVRGFSPHTYHPIPLSIAFHQPSAEHLDMVKDYIDWCVQNKQNYLLFPLLELDKTNPYVPMRSGDDKFKAWLPHAKAIVDYAHQRGVEVSIKVAFANYVSANAYAINPVNAVWQSHRLDAKRKAVTEAQEAVTERSNRLKALDQRLTVAPASEAARLKSEKQRLAADLKTHETKLAARQAEYDDTLAKFAKEDRTKIRAMADRLMQVPWDEITWHIGTSEFTPTNDDLTIAWMNDAAAYMKERYPQTRTAVRSHVPNHPYSEKYQAPYFNLMQFADPAVGSLIHTTHAYALTDKAPVYGNESFEHKLKQLYEATPERREVYYPETSYWVSHDASVPLFLPVYMLNRKHDVEIIKPLKDLDGHVDFTTAWEWGYWLNDYAVARMQSNPNESLTEILDGAFAPFGQAKTPMVSLMNSYMLDQQMYLIDKGLIRHLQGFDKLSDLGASVAQNPVLKNFLASANNIPLRLKPETVMGWSQEQLAAFEQGELADLRAMADSFQATYERAARLADQVPASGTGYYRELLDGFRITSLRARQAKDVLEAAVLARRAKLERRPELAAEGRERVADARRVVEEALEVIHSREEQYKDGPEYTIEKGRTETMWGDRYLTRVHTGEYWRRTLEEAEKLFED